MNNNPLISWCFRALKGALIGTGAILPGISGGVLCVILGIYQPMMDFLAHPFSQFKSKWRFFLPVVVGFGIGVLLLSKLLGALFGKMETQMIWLFVGLILGTLPSLYQECGREGRGRNAYIALGLSFAIALPLFLTLKYVKDNPEYAFEIVPNLFWWFACGILWAIGLIVPGMSPSAMFTLLGLNAPMFDGIGALDMAVLLPMAFGLILTVVLIAHSVQKLLSTRYEIAMHIVLGIALASGLSILPIRQSADASQYWTYALFFLGGLAIALGMCALNKKMEAAGQK